MKINFKIYRFLIITGQSTLSNMMDNKQKEQKIGKKLKNRTIAFQEKHHNTLLRKTIGNLLIHRLVHNNKGVKLGSKKYKPIKVSKERAKVKGRPYTFTKKIRTAVVRQKAYDLSKVAAVGIKKQKDKERKRSSTLPTVTSTGNPGSPMHLLALFNADLEQRIRDNMGQPALVNRTGRFAGSVKVLNIPEVQGTTGNIQYTYQRNPYEVFEGDPSRDPRLLIDKTIREQAAEMALGKFTTQRV